MRIRSHRCNGCATVLSKVKKQEIPADDASGGVRRKRSPEKRERRFMRKRNYLLGALALAVAAAIPATASAAVTSQTISASVSPTKVSTKTPAPVSLTVKTDSSWSAYSPAPTAPTPTTNAADIDFDNDFVFNTKAPVKTCNPTLLAGTTTDQAKAACGAAQVGTGSATLNGVVGPRTAVVTAFNGTPVGGQPQILLHTYVQSINVTQVLPGVLQTSPLHGDYGKRLHVTVPAAQLGGGFEVITHFETTVNKRFTITKKKNGKKVKVKSGYVTARCRDKDKTWNLNSVFSFSNVAPTFTTTTETHSATASVKCKPVKPKK
jgi:hypothetical protein